MMKLTPVPLLLCLVSAAAVSRPLVEAVMKDNDHQKLGKAVADYWEAEREAKDISKTYEELQEALEKQQKRFSKTLPDGDILAAVEDWEQILYHATDIDDKGAKKGRVEDREYDAGGFGMYQMAISTPKKYSTKSGPYPLVIVIPPKGKKAEAHLEEDWTSMPPRDEYVIAVCDMPTNERNWGTVGTPENHGGIDTVMLTLRSVKSTHAIDVDRIFLAGFGEGVAAAAEIAATYPHVFAGVVGRAGDIGDLAPNNFRNLPSMFAGGGERCVSFQTKAKELGFENVSVEAGATEDDVWAWVGGQAREPNPQEVSLAPISKMNAQVYWLLVDSFEPETAPHIHARVDAAENTIHIESEGIGEATIFFNDALLDLSRPVKVVCNGKEHMHEVPRLLRQLLMNASQSGDTGRVYVNRHSYDLIGQ